MKYLYGIDIGGTTVKNGSVWRRWNIKKRNGRSRQELRKMERTSCQILHRQ